MRFRNITTIVLFCLGTLLQAQGQSDASSFSRGRTLFSSSVEHDEDLVKARQIFFHIAKNNAALRGRAMVYLGALDVIEANHAFWPNEKLDFMKKGMKKMAKGLRVAPKDIEARFIHGALCHQLPFFFGYGDEVEEDFTILLGLLEDPSKHCDASVLEDMQDFLEEEEILSETEHARLLKLIANRRAKLKGEKK